MLIVDVRRYTNKRWLGRRKWPGSVSVHDESVAQDQSVAQASGLCVQEVRSPNAPARRRCQCLAAAFKENAWSIRVKPLNVSGRGLCSIGRVEQCSGRMLVLLLNSRWAVFSSSSTGVAKRQEKDHSFLVEAAVRGIELFIEQESGCHVHPVRFPSLPVFVSVCPMDCLGRSETAAVSS